MGGRPRASKRSAWLTIVVASSRASSNSSTWIVALRRVTIASGERCQPIRRVSPGVEFRLDRQSLIEQQAQIVSLRHS